MAVGRATALADRAGLPSWLVKGGCFAAALLALCACAQPSATERYALQERCGKDAQAAFSAVKTLEWTDTANDPIEDYTSHYDPHTNRCFMLYNRLELRFKSGAPLTDEETLYDANELKKVGEFVAEDFNTPSTCEVGKKKCNSETNFKALLKPYLGDEN